MTGGAVVPQIGNPRKMDFVRANIGHCLLERRLEAGVPLALCLAHSLFIVFGVRLCRLDFKQVCAKSAANVTRNDACIAAAREVGDQHTTATANLLRLRAVDDRGEPRAKSNGEHGR